MNDTANPKDFKKILIVSIIIIIVVASASYFIMDYRSNHLTASQWNDDYNAWIETWSNGDNPEFLNFDTGDAIYIKGEISDIYLNSKNTSGIVDYIIHRTWIQLIDCEYPIPFHGDIRDNYTIGDKVTITINIVDGSMWDSTGNELFGEIIEDFNIGLSQDKIS